MFDIRISKSAFMAYEWCPRSYKYRYIDGMRQPPTIPMRLGSAFHSFASTFSQSVNYNALYDVDSRIQVKEVLLETSRRMEAPATLTNDIANFIEFETGRFWDLHESPETKHDPVKYYTPVFVEEYMKARDPFEGYDDVILSGIMDRGDLTVNDTIVLIELKRSPKLNAQRLQKELLFYSILYEKAGVYEYPVTDMVAYTPVTNQYLHIQMNRRKQKHVEKRIIKMIEDDEYQCKENLFCSNCVGADICLNSVVDVDEILKILEDSGEAYTVTEITKILKVQRSLVKATLSDLHIVGAVEKAVKGKTEYYYIEAT